MALALQTLHYVHHLPPIISLIAGALFKKKDTEIQAQYIPLFNLPTDDDVKEIFNWVLASEDPDVVKKCGWYKKPEELAYLLIIGYHSYMSALPFVYQLTAYASMMTATTATVSTLAYGASPYSATGVFLALCTGLFYIQKTWSLANNVGILWNATVEKGFIADLAYLGGLRDAYAQKTASILYGVQLKLAQFELFEMSPVNMVMSLMVTCIGIGLAMLFVVRLSSNITNTLNWLFGFFNPIQSDFDTMQMKLRMADVEGKCEMFAQCVEWLGKEVQK